MTLTGHTATRTLLERSPAPLGPNTSDFRSFAAASLDSLQYPGAEIPKFCKLIVEKPEPLVQDDHTVANPPTTTHYKPQELQLLKNTDVRKSTFSWRLASFYVKDVKRHTCGRKSILQCSRHKSVMLGHRASRG